MRRSTLPLWLIARNMIPKRDNRGRQSPVSDRVMFKVIVDLVTNELPFNDASKYGVSADTATRRFVAWSDANLWNRLYADTRRLAVDNSARVLAGKLRYAAFDRLSKMSERRAKVVDERTHDEAVREAWRR